ncbi:MAG: TIGR00303 family protein [Archaeoglobaceae archaeon]
MSDLMLIVLGNTEIATIPSISVAGASPELTKFTPLADIEYIILDKPVSIDEIPVTPEGHPTPAIITKACYQLADFSCMAVRGGSYLPPALPHIFVSDEAGKDFRKEKAVPQARNNVESAKLLGRELNKLEVDEIVIGESTPGGTTTAQAVLRALGYDANTSSASPQNPQEIKDRVIDEGFKRTGSSEYSQRPLSALEEFGDPMLATVLGLSLGLNKRIVLAGGTQLLAVAAILKSMGKDVSRIEIATTKYIVEDRSASFKDTAKEIGVNYHNAMLDFSHSKFKGLKDYEKGYVKEGAGAGGSVYMAKNTGFSEEDVAGKVEELYHRLQEEHTG